MTKSKADRIWKSLAAGLCGSAAHSGLMFLKYRMAWLPSFHPYEDMQQALSGLVGGSVPPAIPWALSFLNGAVVLGILFGRLYRFLPGRSGADFLHGPSPAEGRRVECGLLGGIMASAAKPPVPRPSPCQDCPKKRCA